MAISPRHVKSNTLRQLLRASSFIPAITTTATHTQHAMSNSATNNFNFHQTRSYAGPKSPRAPLRKPPRAPRLIPSQPQAQTQFKASTAEGQYMTPSDFESAIQQCKGIINTLTPQEYYDHAVKFAEAVTEAKNIRINSLADLDIPVETAHELGCLLYLNKSPLLSALGRLFFIAASGENYNPSTITVARLYLLRGDWGKSPESRVIEKRFMELVSEGKDCNALTVYGESLFKAGRFAAAIPIFNQALSVDDGIFEWKNMCMRCLAKSYAQLGKVDEAKETLKALGDPAADAEVAPMLATGSVEGKRQRLFSEAFLGKKEAYRELAELEFGRGAKETDKDLKRDYNLWGMEWSRLADQSAKY